MRIVIDKQSEIPLYEQIRLQIVRNIDSGNLQPGEKLPAERQIALDLDVNRMTVRHATNALVNEDILIRKRSHGLFVSETYFKRIESGDVYFLYPGENQTMLMSSFYNRIFNGALHEAQKNGLRLIYENINNYENIQKNRRDIFGFLAVAGRQKSDLSSVKFSDTPVCLVDCGSFSSIDVDSIDVDNLRASQLAVQYLMERGHRDIAIVLPKQMSNAFHKRYSGYYKVLQEAGRKIDPGLAFGIDWLRLKETIRDTAKSLAEMKKRPTAIFVTDDTFALPLMWALLELGIRIPDEISLIGLGNDNGSLFSIPSLTTVKLNEDNMGRRAVQLLMERKKDPERYGLQLLSDVEIVERESVRSL